MIIVQLADIDHVTIDYSLLSQQVILQSDKLTGKRKKQFLVCRALIAALLKQYYQIHTLPDMVISQNGRPAFSDNKLPDFNISHSQNFVAVALSNEGKIGIDIEFARQKAKHLAIAHTFFSAIENQWLKRQEDTLSAFWQLWTLKESALKLYAKGVWQMKTVNVDVEKRTILAPFSQQFHYQYHQLNNIHLAINSSETIKNLCLVV